jgi:hypothetical protein
MPKVALAQERYWQERPEVEVMFRLDKSVKKMLGKQNIPKNLFGNKNYKKFSIPSPAKYNWKKNFGMQDIDMDGVPDVRDCKPLNPKKQDDWKMIVDYVAVGRKPYGVFPIYSDQNYMNQILTYIQARGLQYTISESGLGTKEVVVFKPGKQPLGAKRLWKEVRTKGADVMLGYPEKAVRGWKAMGGARGVRGIYESYPNIYKSDLHYLDFNPSGMTDEEVRAEIQKRKLAATSKPLTDEQVYKQDVKHGIVLEGPRTQEIIRKVEAAGSKEEALRILEDED